MTRGEALVELGEAILIVFGTGSSAQLERANALAEQLGAESPEGLAYWRVFQWLSANVGSPSDVATWSAYFDWARGQGEEPPDGWEDYAGMFGKRMVYKGAIAVDDSGAAWLGTHKAWDREDVKSLMRASDWMFWRSKGQE